MSKNQNEIIIQFGKFKGHSIETIPLEYLQWMVEHATNVQSDPKLRQACQDRIDRLIAAKELEDRTNRILGGFEPLQNTVYVVTHEYHNGPSIHETLDDALKLIDALYPLSDNSRSFDKEDDRILVWEVLASGHKKIVWHATGWRYSQEAYGIEQGTLPGDPASLYSMGYAY